MFILQLIVECLLFTVCGWVGHVAVKAATFGKVDLDSSGSGSVLADWLGFFFLLMLAGLTAWILHR